jgi:hypothetical protein
MKERKNIMANTTTTTTTTKMTKKETFEAMLKLDQVQANEQFVKTLKHEIELLGKRSSSKAESNKKKENEGVKDVILVELGKVKKATVSALIGTEALSKYTNQKISALLRQLIAEGKVEKTTEKRVSYFSIAGGSGVEDSDESPDTAEESED